MHFLQFADRHVRIDLFSPAQRIRLDNYARDTTNIELKRSIIESLEHAHLRNSIYYLLLLQPPPELDYGHIRELYSEFASANEDLFDFGQFRVLIRGTRGVCLEFDAADVAMLPACATLFAMRIAQTAHAECRVREKAEAIAMYDKLIANRDSKQMDSAMRMLHLDPQSLRRQVAELTGSGVSPSCSDQQP